MSRRSRRSRARSCSLHGSTTAPSRKQATIASTHSGRLPTSVITTSPRPIPRAASAPANRALRSASSPKAISVRDPSRPSAMSAGRSGGAASTRSRAKFMRGAAPRGGARAGSLRSRPVRLVGVLALVSLLVAAPAADAKRRKPTTTTRAAAGYRVALPALHAEPDPARGGRIVDAHGREVLLRGVNVNALADYWKGTELPTTFPLAPEDPGRMAAIGWDAVRLLVSWSRVEPEPGRYDEAYLDTVAAAAQALRDEGLYTIVDFHQDAWGPSLAATGATVCVPPSEPAIGWDGAPAWATLDDGLPRCFTSQREIDPAVHQAWQSFLDDAEGVQARYVAMVGHVAQRFAAAPWIA